MSKGPSEDIFRKALGQVDIDPFYIFKPSDVGHASNTKPCDFMTWLPENSVAPQYALSAWFEVKETPNISTWPINDLRPSQMQGIATAKALRLPYFLGIRWKTGGMWSLVDAVRLIDWVHGPSSPVFVPGKRWSVSRSLLESRFGVSSTPGQLPNMIRAALIEGL